MSHALTEALRPIVDATLAAERITAEQAGAALHALDDIDGRLSALEQASGQAGNKPTTSTKTTRK